jgi:hypothetical protein
MRRSSLYTRLLQEQKNDRLVTFWPPIGLARSPSEMQGASTDESTEAGLAVFAPLSTGRLDRGGSVARPTAFLLLVGTT